MMITNILIVVLIVLVITLLVILLKCSNTLRDNSLMIKEIYYQVTGEVWVPKDNIKGNILRRKLKLEAIKRKAEELADMNID